MRWQGLLLSVGGKWTLCPWVFLRNVIQEGRSAYILHDFLCLPGMAESLCSAVWSNLVKALGWSLHHLAPSILWLFHKTLRILPNFWLWVSICCHQVLDEVTHKTVCKASVLKHNQVSLRVSEFGSLPWGRSQICLIIGCLFLQTLLDLYPCISCRQGKYWMERFVGGFVSPLPPLEILPG